MQMGMGMGGGGPQGFDAAPAYKHEKEGLQMAQHSWVLEDCELQLCGAAVAARARPRPPPRSAHGGPSRAAQGAPPTPEAVQPAATTSKSGSERCCGGRPTKAPTGAQAASGE